MIENKPLLTRKDKGRAAFKAMRANFEEKEEKPPILQPKHFPEAAKWDKKVPMPRVSTPE